MHRNLVQALTLHCPSRRSQRAAERPVILPANREPTVRRFPLVSLALIALLAAISSGCAGGPTSTEPTRASSSTAVPERITVPLRAEETVEPPPDADPLPAGDYGLRSGGGQLTPTLALRALDCRADDTLQLATDDGSYLVQIVALPDWTCTEALEQARTAAGPSPAGMRVGIRFQAGTAVEPGQVLLVWSNGSSVTYVAEGLYKAR